MQDEVFPDRDHFGRIFFNQAQMSAQGIPQIAVVMGSCTAGGAYVPAMSDETIIVRGTGTIFIGGPPLVKAATGQDVTAEELGGADVHTRQSGVADYYAVSDEHALALARQIVRNLQGRKPEPPWVQAEPEPPAADPAELYGLIPEDFRHQTDAREVIARIVDGSRFDEFKALYGETLVTGLRAHRGLSGRDSGEQRRPVRRVVAEGRALHRARDEAPHPARLPPEHHRLHGREGVRGRRYRAGRRQARHGGGECEGAEVHGDRRRVVRRRQLRHVRARLRAAAAVDVAERAHLRDGRRAGCHVLSMVGDADPDEIRAKYEREGSPYYSTARLWDDGIIDPLDTRRVLALGLSASLNAPIPETTFGVFRM